MQFIEIPFLNLVNFQIFVVTKSVRICAVIRGEFVLEFGLRWAQGFDGGIYGVCVVYVGGAVGMFNVLVGKIFGILIKGTYVYSWVMCFDLEIEFFESYVCVFFNNCVFLVDIYDTVDGVRWAISVGEKLWERGYCMVGVWLDSGDLCVFSIEVR